MITEHFSEPKRASRGSMLPGKCLKKQYNLLQVPHTVTLVQGSSIASLEWVCWREKEEKRESQK